METVALTWWQVVGGVLSIPAAAIGIVYSVALLKKTNLESQKIELEIAERRANLRAGATPPLSPDDGARMASSLEEARGVNVLLVRFVILSVLLMFWGIVEWAGKALVAGVAIAGVVLHRLLSGQPVQEAFQGNIELGPLGEGVAFVALQAFEHSNFVVLLVLGWPLLRDVNRWLGVNKVPTAPATTSAVATTE